MVTSVANNTASVTSGASTGKTEGLAKDFNTFLQLLSTQLQNQDPLDPMDTNQFTQQLVMYSQVEQQIGTNTRLDSLVNSQIATQNNLLTSTSVGYIGKDVTFKGDQLYFDGTNDTRFTYTFEGTPNTSEIRIIDQSGTTVRRIDGSKTPGTNAVIWDGTDDYAQAVPAGVYRIQANLFDKNGKSISVTNEIAGSVEGVETDGNGAVALNLNGNRQIDLTNVLSVRQSGTGLANTNT